MSVFVSEACFGRWFLFLFLYWTKDTLKSPPSEDKTMKKASIIAISITTFFYLCCGCFGYAAFGNQTPGNLLTGFGFYEPYWLIDFANACIVLHLVGGYQVIIVLNANNQSWQFRFFNMILLNFSQFRFIVNRYIVLRINGVQEDIPTAVLWIVSSDWNCLFYRLFS